MANENLNITGKLFKGAEPGQPPRFRYRYLYYITHVDNIKSIMENGILSHEKISYEKIAFTPIYKTEIVNLRRGKKTPDDKSLWYYANFYLQPRNPMLYLVKRGIGSNNIAVLACYRGPAYETENAFITDGNAASNVTNFYPVTKRNLAFESLKDVDGLDYWKEEDGTKRKMMAEVLIPESYPPAHIHSILVSNQSTKDKVEDLIKDIKLKPKIIVDPRTFFDPDYESKITENLTLVKGDMFFSGLQTLTVSVNTKGVMGRGLASRAKYQFPDVYIYYQDSCKNKKLRMGHPVIYKREAALDMQLADDPLQITDPNHQTWFLLFATKDDWRNPADKQGIVDGLEWLIQNYRSEGIKSLAIPALGCGLGWLSWNEIGPILCKYLSKMDIPVQLYLPAERPIPEDQLTKSFLLG
ncbi:MAG: DarT ssDNA thymidine ADP-ribosyltransferase family protein [Thermoplasmataceae archaeon]